VARDAGFQHGIHDVTVLKDRSDLVQPFESWYVVFLIQHLYSYVNAARNAVYKANTFAGYKTDVARMETDGKVEPIYNRC